MLTNEDIIKLGETLATKEDFKELRKELKEFKIETNEKFVKLVTLDEFSQFKTEIDEKFVKLVTLDEFSQFKTEIDGKFIKLVTLNEFDQFKKEIKEDVNNLRESIQALTLSVDKLVKLMETSIQENVMIKNKMDIYEKWFNLIADKLGIKLEY